VSGSCRNSSTTFSTYANYFIWPVLLGCLPVAIMLIFAILSYISVRRISKAQINTTRLSHERQITSMVLVYVVFIIVLSLPCILYSIYALNPPYTDTESTARGRLIYGLLSFFYYESYACSFYIYCCVSKRFRKQLLYVLFEVHLKRWRKAFGQLQQNQVGIQQITSTTN
ncbi:unnamed protein product, partial [Adineta ricciae]